jgi:hypothetical protein
MEMAALYRRHGTPFVMGTTGGDRAALVADTEVCVCGGRGAQRGAGRFVRLGGAGAGALILKRAAGELRLARPSRGGRRARSGASPAQAGALARAPPLQPPTLPPNPPITPQAAGVYAVIAPQMGKQVVALQAVLEMMADSFPGAFGGYTLDVVESHQAGKKDTSGTAKARAGPDGGGGGGVGRLGAGGGGAPGRRRTASRPAGGRALPPPHPRPHPTLPTPPHPTPTPPNHPTAHPQAIVASFRALGAEGADEASIRMVRDPREAVASMGVPPEHLGGHAYHTYRLASPDGSVGFEFQHNVCGRWARARV